MDVTVQLTTEEARVIDKVLETVELCTDTMGLDEWAGDDSLAGTEYLLSVVRKQLQQDEPDPIAERNANERYGERDQLASVSSWMHWSRLAARKT